MAEKIFLDQQAENHLKQYQAELKVQKQELLQELKITLSSRKKLEILKKIDQIEDEIKRDKKILIHQEKIIEREKSKLQKEVESELQSLKATVKHDRFGRPKKAKAAVAMSS